MYLQVASKFGQFRLAFFIHFDLGGSRAASLVETLAQLLELALNLGSGTIGLGAGLTLRLELLLQFADSRLKFFDLTLQFSDQ